MMIRDVDGSTFSGNPAFAIRHINLSFASPSRWFLINIPYIRYIRNLTGISNVGPAPPTILRISDGGHVENLGLLPLLQRRLPKIVVVNGVGIDSDAEYGVELLYALQMAREKLRCSFIGMDGRDVLEDVRANFVEKKPGEQPRSYKYVSSTTFHPPLPLPLTPLSSKEFLKDHAWRAKVNPKHKATLYACSKCSI